MATLSKSSKSNSSAKYQSVNICVDPKTRNLDATMRDILHISNLMAEHMPSARLQSIMISDYFAIVKAIAPKNRGKEEITVRLYEIKGTWRIRGCAFEKNSPEQHRVVESSQSLM